MDYYIKSAKNQPSIIDSFLIIGYDIQEQEIKMSGDGEITLVNPNPTVLSEVSAFNTTRKIILENQLIYNIFPEPPPIYSINISDRAEKIKDYNVTFSIFDEQYYMPAVTVYVYGYVFYEQIDNYFCPKCFCIVSQYPNYSYFRLLTRKIYSEFENENRTIPVEAFIINIINFVPPQQTYPIIIDFDSINDIQKSLSNSNLQTLEEVKADIKRNKTSTALHNLIQPMEVKSLIIHEVGSFPYIDLNINRLLTVMEPKILAMILAISFFEMSLYICIDNLPVVSSVIHIISQLSYPFHETLYYRNIVFLPKKAFEDMCCRYIGWPVPNMIGIYGKAEVFDNIETGIVCQLELEEQKNKANDFPFKDINCSFYITIRDMVKEYTKSHKKSKKQDDILKSSLYSLINRLSSIKPSYEMLKKSFYIDDSFDHMVNYQIQNASYQFRLDLLVSPYSTYKIKNTYDEIVKQFNTFYITKNSYTIINTKEHSNSSWETDLFSSFQFGEFKRFIDNNKCEEKKRMDMYFFLIFLQYNKFLKENDIKQEINYMNIIKEYYNIGSTVHINFSNFEQYYEENMKSVLEKEIKKTEILSHINEDTNQSNSLKELDNSLMKKYVYLLGNIPKDKFYNIFPLLKNVNSNEKNEIDFNTISRKINQLIESNQDNNEPNLYFLRSILNISITTFYILKKKSPIFYIIENSLNKKLPPIYLRQVINEMLYLLYSMYQQKTKIDKEYQGEEELPFLTLFINYLVKFNFVPDHDLFKLIQKICALESRALGLIPRQTEIPTSNQDNPNPNEYYKIEFETASKKQKKQELSNTIKTTLLQNIPPKEPITIKLLKKENGTVFTSNLYTMKLVYEKSYEVLNAYIKEKRISDNNKLLINTLIINLMACSVIKEYANVDLKGVLNVLGLFSQ